jgi:hypothetical protein
MQDERSGDADLGEIRDRHHELTRKIVLRSVEQPLSDETIPLDIVRIPGITYVVALVAESHRKVNLYQDKYDGFILGSEIIRPRLLAALLRFADELDIDWRRAIR